MFARRAAFAVLFSLIMAGSLGLAALALSPGGLGIFDVIALVLFAITLPWMVAGFCNAVIGFVIMRFSADPVAAVLPAIARIRDDDPVTASTAILLCVRNELPVRTIRNLEPMLEGLFASGYGEHFHLYLLSDTNDAELAIGEEALFSELITTWCNRIAISYRRREVNSGFKAGNVRDFCERWGSGHAGALILLVTTEKSLVGAVVFLLAWIVLNCLCLALVRRPTVAALISLEILITLTLLSRFKFDKLWMTVDFVDVMIVDRDTTAFLLAIFPALRWWIVLAGAATLVVIVLAWRFDRLRVRLRESVAGFAASAVVLIAVSLLWPTGLNENFEDRSYVSKFARTAVEAVHEASGRATARVP